MLNFETLILGAGPGGTGSLIWAAGHGLLDQWLDRGVGIVDVRASIGGSIGGYALNADSEGRSFLECLERPDCHAALVELRQHPLTAELERYRSQRPPLGLVGRFGKALGAALARAIEAHPASRFLPRTRVTALRLQSDGTVIARLMDEQERACEVSASSVVVALGGVPQWRDIGLPACSAWRWRDKTMTSDLLLSRDGRERAANLLGRSLDPRVVIVGGSHSAFSAAWTLLERVSGVRFGPAAIQMLHRSEPRIFYPSAQAASEHGYRFRPDDVCPFTGRVNRLGGLRGDGRELWLRIQGSPGADKEHRAVIRPLSELQPDMLDQVLQEATLVITAFGYRLATVPIFDASGRRVGLASTGPCVGPDGHLLAEDNQPLPGVFGVGLGSGFVPQGAMGGEPSFRGQQNSLWLYQNGLGGLIYKGVRNHAAQVRTRNGTTPLAARRHDGEVRDDEAQSEGAQTAAGIATAEVA